MDAYHQFIFPIVMGGASLAKSADMRRTTSQNQNLQSNHGTAVPENEKKVLTDAENMSQVREAGRVQLMVQGVLLPELWRTV